MCDMDEFVRELKESAAGLHDGMGGHADYCAELMETAAQIIEAKQLEISYHQEVAGRPRIIERLSMACTFAIVAVLLFQWIFG